MKDALAYETANRTSGGAANWDRDGYAIQSPVLSEYEQVMLGIWRDRQTQFIEDWLDEQAQLIEVMEAAE